MLKHLIVFFITITSLCNLSECLLIPVLPHIVNYNFIDYILFRYHDNDHIRHISYEDLKKQNIKEYLIKKDENTIYIKLNNNNEYYYICKDIKFYTGKSSEIILIKN